MRKKPDFYAKWELAAKKGSGKNATVWNRLDYNIEKTPAGQLTGMKLQPAFVEHIMAFPIGWTSLD